MEQNNLQIREHFTPNCVKMREVGQGEKPIIEGEAILFNQPTILYEDEDIVVREEILPSCVTEQFLREQVIALNLLHKRELSFAMWDKGEGSLHIQLRENCVAFETEKPECELGNQAVALIGNGTYRGCSFEFYEGDYDRIQTTAPDGRTDILYRHKTFTKITALTIAMNPAYEGTKVSAREKELIKRELDNVGKVEAEKAKLQEQKEAAKREAIRNLRAEAAKIFA